MNSLQSALVKKAGNENGFEVVERESAETGVALASALHRARVVVTLDEQGAYLLTLAQASPTLAAEMARSFPETFLDGESAFVNGEAGLGKLLHRIADLARALPNQAERAYHDALARELATLPPDIRGTEVERLVRQRVGQEKFRAAMLDYWGGACAVTGVSVTEALRASHAKPWAECATDAERLDVFNGFLLAANLDALFDRFLISFADDGKLLVSSRLTARNLAGLGVTPDMRPRWLTDEHRRYLAYHRERLS